MKRVVNSDTYHDRDDAYRVFCVKIATALIQFDCFGMLTQLSVSFPAKKLIPHAAGLPGSGRPMENFGYRTEMRWVSSGHESSVPSSRCWPGRVWFWCQ